MPPAPSRRSKRNAWRSISGTGACANVPPQPHAIAPAGNSTPQVRHSSAGSSSSPEGELFSRWFSSARLTAAATAESAGRSAGPNRSPLRLGPSASSAASDVGVRRSGTSICEAAVGQPAPILRRQAADNRLGGGQGHVQRRAAAGEQQHQVRRGAQGRDSFGRVDEGGAPVVGRRAASRAPPAAPRRHRRARTPTARAPWSRRGRDPRGWSPGSPSRPRPGRSAGRVPAASGDAVVARRRRGRSARARAPRCGPANSIPSDSPRCSNR